MSRQTPSAIRDLLERHDVRLRKGLGQHFLADPNIIERIVAVAGVDSASRVVEVGAGSGALTLALATAGPAQLIAYEVDRSLEPLLDEILPAGVDLRFADITEVDLQRELEVGSWMLVANLPYNVGTPLVLDVLRHVPAVERLVVMIQREVADRFVAQPGSRTYGLPSVVVGLHARAHVAFPVPRQVFVPPPNVDSSVLVADRSPAPPLAEKAIELAAQAFGGRRKMLRRSLSDVAGIETHLESAGVDPTSRPEDLAPSDFLRLAEAVGG